MPEDKTFSTKTGIIDPGYNNTVTAVSRPPKSSVEAAVPAAIPSHATRLCNASARRTRVPPQIRKQKRPAGRFRLGVLKFYLKGTSLSRTALVTDISASLLDRPLQHFPRYHRASSQSAFEILPDWSNPRLWPDLL